MALTFIPAVIAMFLPMPLKRFIYTRVLGWSVHPTARIGISFVHAASVDIGEGCTIGHFNLIKIPGTVVMRQHSSAGFGNVIKGCETVDIGEGARIAWLNWISGKPSMPYLSTTTRTAAFYLGEYSDIVRNHQIDCSDSVTIGAFCLMAGRRSFILSHQFDVMTDMFITRPVVIGHHCLINAEVLIQPGAVIAEKTVVAPRAVVSGGPGSPGQMIGGVPARAIRQLPTGAEFFTRSKARPTTTGSRRGIANSQPDA